VHPYSVHAGDRFGRKTLIVTGCTIFSLATLATVWATSLDQVVALRALAGIGLGGLMPNAIALNSELAPKRLRATLIVLMFTGISAGAGIPGAIQAWLIAHYGWQVMFWIGGLAPLIVATCLLFTLPESVRFLALKPHRRAEFLRTVRRLRRDLAIPDSTRFCSRARAARQWSKCHADLQRGLRLDHADSVGLFRQCAHGKLLFSIVGCL